ncbi:MAG TPA: hypothetical protein VFX96_17065 [Pyrinomonadaceae bacterium]|nr:hypothetical protein [Pyrinomonadaceae bacterium]
MNRPSFGSKLLRTLPACLGLLAVVFAAGSFSPSHAQQERYAVNLAQAAVRERILREQGDGSSSVTFESNRQTQTYRVSNNQTGVRGEGVFRRDFNGPSRRFTYEAVVNTRNNRVQPISYNFVGGVDGDYNNEFSDVPDWLIGTFRGRNPTGRQGQLMSVSVDRTGSVLAVYDNGTRDSGRYVNGQIQLGNTRQAWSVTRVGSGFRATARRRSENFIRTSDDFDGRGDNDRVPRWVVGTFRGTTDRGESELTISSDGAASIRSLSSNEIFYGRYDDRSLRFDWGTYEVTRARNGLRTTNVGDRNDTTDYRRVN